MNYISGGRKMVKKNTTWILVADGTQASIYGYDGPGRGIYPAIDKNFAIDLPSKVGDILSDQEGRAANPGGKGHHSIGPRTDPRRHQETEFLRSVATYLDEAAQTKMYDRLVLVAAPKALGDLRSFLSSHAAGLVTKELDKDLVHLSEADLEKHLMAADAIL
jgi:protein required for attachment to host cells